MQCRLRGFMLYKKVVISCVAYCSLRTDLVESSKKSKHTMTMWRRNIRKQTGERISYMFYYVKTSFILIIISQVLAALRYFAKGYLSEHADMHGISIASMSKVIERVANYFVSIAPDHICYRAWINMNLNLNSVLPMRWCFHSLALTPAGKSL